MRPGGVGGDAGRDLARDHYDHFPYDVGVSQSDAYLSAGHPVGAFLQTVAGGLIVDVGCGPGQLLDAAAERADLVVGIDISMVSLGLAARTIDGRAGGAGVVSLVCGDSADLPFADGAADAAMAIGSLHHTADAEVGFSELMRIVRPGGTTMVVLYRSGGLYRRAYQVLGGPARWAEHRAVTRALSRVTLLPLFALYTLVGRLIVHRRLRPPTYRQLLNYFADQLLNPLVSFHSEGEVQAWVQAAGATVEHSSTSHLGSLLNMSVRTRGSSAP